LFVLFLLSNLSFFFNLAFLITPCM
jgi:hypothetical protein